MIVGRDGEQAVLAALVDDARNGKGRCVLLHGEPGIGKTSLLAEAIVHAAQSGVITLTACGHEWEADLPYAALIDFLQPISELIDELPRPQATVLRRALGIETSDDRPATHHVAIEVAATALLRAAARRQPLLLVIDDLPWIDRASRDVVLYVARRAGSAHLGFIGAARTADLAPDIAALPRVEVGPLDADSSAQLLAIRAGGDLAASATRTVVGLARGNPLALRELIDGLSSQQRQGRAPIVQPIEVSTPTLVAFGQRVDQLTPAARRVLLTAAAEGRGRIDRVMAASPDDPMPGLDEAVGAGLAVVAGDVIEFRHPLVRSVVYQSAEPADVRSVHAALAAVEDDPDRMAWHLSAAALNPSELTSEALAATARRAVSRGADSTAAAAFERAAELAPDLRRRGFFYFSAARSAHSGGDVRTARRLVEAARPLVSRDLLMQADFTLLDADLHMREGDFQTGQTALIDEAERLAGTDPGRSATMLAYAAKRHVYRIEGADALRLVERAVELMDDVSTDILFQTSLAMTRVMCATPDAIATALDAKDLAMATPRGHLFTLGVGWPLLWCEQFGEARAFLEHAAQAQRDGGFDSTLPLTLLATAELEFRTGHWERAVSLATEAITRFEATGQLVDRAVAHGTLARIEAARGHVTACNRHAAIAHDDDKRTGLRASTAFAHTAIGHLALCQRRFDDAIAHLAAAADVLAAGGTAERSVVNVDADLCEALVAVGRTDEARIVASRLKDASDVAERPLLHAFAERAEALVLAPDDPQAAIDAFCRALTHHDNSPAVFERARTMLCLADLVQMHDPDDARAASFRGSAIETFVALGARLWTDRARAPMRRADGQAVEAASALTTREAQVAELVASGASNREVADSLFVNAKTVEYHLVNVYRKLGVRSRTELALRWSRD